MMSFSKNIDFLSRSAGHGRDRGRLRGAAGKAAFMTNPAGSAIVNATGAIRQVVQGEAGFSGAI
jgi:hypothetical protein